MPTAIKIDAVGLSNEVLKELSSVLANPRLGVITIECFRFADGLLPRHFEMEATLESQGFHPFNYVPAVRMLQRLSDPLEGRHDSL